MKKIYFILAIVLANFCIEAQTVTPMSIADARIPGAHGNPLDSGMTVQLTGVAYGPNFYPNHYGLTFYINQTIGDSTWGIEVYSGHNFGYHVNDGDSVVVVGALGGFHSNAEVILDETVSVDTIYKVGTMPTATPLLNPTLGPMTDGILVEMDGVNMTGSNWPVTPPTNKHDFTVHAGNLYIYIDSFMNYALFNMSPPQGLYNIIGFGTQYNTNFSIYPRRTSDFIAVTGISSISNDASAAVIYPNPSNGGFNMKFSDNAFSTADVSMFDVSGRMVYLAKKSVNDGLIKIDPEDFNPGIYIVEVRSGENIFRNKITVQK